MKQKEQPKTPVQQAIAISNEPRNKWSFRLYGARAFVSGFFRRATAADVSSHAGARIAKLEHKSANHHVNGDYQAINRRIADLHLCLASLSKDKKVEAEHREKAASRFRIAREPVLSARQFEVAAGIRKGLGEIKAARDDMHNAADVLYQSGRQNDAIRMQQKTANMEL